MLCAGRADARQTWRRAGLPRSPNAREIFALDGRESIFGRPWKAARHVGSRLKNSVCTLARVTGTDGFSAFSALATGVLLGGKELEAHRDRERHNRCST